MIRLTHKVTGQDIFIDYNEYDQKLLAGIPVVAQTNRKDVFTFTPKMREEYEVRRGRYFYNDGWRCESAYNEKYLNGISCDVYRF